MHARRRGRIARHAHTARGQRGQAAIEYLGVIAAAGLLVIAVAAGAPRVTDAVADGLRAVVCSLTQADECGSGGSGMPQLGSGASAGSDGAGSGGGSGGAGEPGGPGAQGLPDVSADGLGTLVTGGGVAGANTLAAGDSLPGGGETCFASTASACGPAVEGTIQLPAPDVCATPVRPGDESADGAQNCGTDLEKALARLPAELRDQALGAIEGALAAQGCSGFAELGETRRDCDLAERVHVAEHVIDHLLSRPADERGELAERIAAGVEEVPELRPRQRDEGCPSGLLADIIGTSAACAAAKALGEGNVLSAALNAFLSWPGSKPAKAIKELADEVVQWVGSRGAREGAAGGIARALPDDIAQTFKGGKYTVRTLDEDLILYRRWGGRADELGAYWSRTNYQRAGNARRHLALPPGNTAQNVTKIRVPAGTTLYEGRAAGHLGWGHPGGGNQVVFDPGFRVPRGWIEP